MVFITTYSNSDTGNLWIGQNENNMDCSSKVSEVSIYLIILSFHADTDYKLNSG